MAPSSSGRAPVRRAVLLSLLAGCARSITAPSTAVVPDSLRTLFLIQWTSRDGLRVGSDAAAPHAFVIDRGDVLPPLAVTAHHVVAPGTTRWDQVAQLVASGFLFSPFDVAQRIPLDRNVPIAGAHTIGASGSQDDVAAFELRGASPSQRLQLARTPPAVGDTVWVYASMPGITYEFRHPARVAVSHDSAFVYVYLGPNATNLTSGAAVLDRDGRVVGVNVGSLVASADDWRRFAALYGPCCDGVRGGEAIGLAVGLPALRRHLELR